MEIIISLMLVALLFMIYDLINAPAVDEDENLLISEADGLEEGDSKYENVLY